MAIPVLGGAGYIGSHTVYGRAGDPARFVAPAEKAKKNPGWKPEYDDLNTIVSTAREWHRSHPNGYGE